MLTACLSAKSLNGCLLVKAMCIDVSFGMVVTKIDVELSTMQSL